MKTLFIFIALAFGIAASSSAQSPFPQVAEEDKHKTGRAVIVVAPGLASYIFSRTTADFDAKTFRPTGPFVREDKNLDVQYRARVPENYTKDEPFGLFVWISHGDGPGIPKVYRELMDKHRLIGISAANSGNDHPSAYRVGYAIQAVELMKQRYNIDPDRVYVSGHSGGGRMASYAMMLYSEVFSGGMPVCGANEVASKDRLAKPAMVGRFAFLTGEKDYNKPGTQKVFNAYSKMGFNYLKYIEQPGLGHKVVSEATMNQAIEFVDSALPAIAEVKSNNASKLAKSQPGDAILLYQSAIRHGGAAPWVPKAKENLEKLTSKYEKSLATLKSKSQSKSLRRLIDRFEKTWGTYGSADVEELRKLGPKPGQ